MSGKPLIRSRLLRLGSCILAAAVVALFPAFARAIPAFATQTGQPCTACQIGAYGPQVTAFGRAFKIGGYTQTGGGAAIPMPFSVMLLGSYSNTTKGQGGPAADNYGPNGNFAMDQISIFAGGRITDYAGALIQGTFNGVASSSHLGNSDVRLTAPFDVNNTELRLGLDINNSPTVQDPYNSSYAWGYPYVSSILVPTPTEQPILVSALAGNSIGATVYAWYDRSLYLEGKLYNTFGPSLLSWTGNAYGPGSTANPAPYLRAAYEWNWNGQSAHVGGIFLHSNSTRPSRRSPAMVRWATTATPTMQSTVATSSSATARMSFRYWPSSITRARTSSVLSTRGPRAKPGTR